VEIAQLTHVIIVSFRFRDVLVGALIRGKRTEEIGLESSKCVTSGTRRKI
jgi:hypothetical protein